MLFSGSGKFGSGVCYYDLIPTPRKAIEECQMPNYPMKLKDLCMKYDKHIYRYFVYFFPLMFKTNIFHIT